MPHEILRAIRGGDSARVREILERDPSAAASRDADGVSAILLALHHRANEALDLLLREDPDLDVFEAAALGRTDQLRRCLRENPSQVAARSGDGSTPLHLACVFAPRCRRPADRQRGRRERSRRQRERGPSAAQRRGGRGRRDRGVAVARRSVGERPSDRWPLGPARRRRGGEHHDGPSPARARRRSRPRRRQRPNARRSGPRGRARRPARPAGRSMIPCSKARSSSPSG